MTGIFFMVLSAMFLTAVRNQNTVSADETKGNVENSVTQVSEPEIWEPQESATSENRETEKIESEKELEEEQEPESKPGGIPEPTSETKQAEEKESKEKRNEAESTFEEGNTEKESELTGLPELEGTQEPESGPEAQSECKNSESEGDSQEDKSKSECRIEPQTKDEPKAATESYAEADQGTGNPESKEQVENATEDTSRLTAQQLAGKYLTTKIGMGMHKYYLPVVVIVGMVGNTIALLVMLQEHNKRITCCVYLAALAVSDNLFLYVGAHYWTMSVQLKDHFTEPMCKYLAYMFQTTSNLSAILITIVTGDRFLAVCFPLKLTTIRRPGNARRIAIGAYITAFSWNSPIIYTARLIPPINCAAIGGSNLFNKVYSWLTFCTNALLPFFTLCVLNLFIIRAIRNRNKYFENLRNEEENQGAPAAEKGTRESNRGKPSATSTSTKESSDANMERQLSIMLLVVTMAFLLLTAPQYTRYIIFAFLEYENDPKLYGIANLLFHVSNKLLWTNSAVNFFLYCVGGSKFRADLRKLFACQKPMTESRSYSSVTSVSRSVDAPQKKTQK